MNKTRFGTSLVLALVIIGFAGRTHGAEQRNLVMWYRQPGEKWLEAMPIGNGYMGAMVFGGIEQERIALNESSFWSGRLHDYNDANAIKYLPQIRDLVLAGKFKEAEKMADDHFWGIPRAQQAYEPIGNYTNINGNPAAICQQVLSRSGGKDYATLRQRHENDFRGLMSRVHLMSVMLR